MKKIVLILGLLLVLIPNVFASSYTITSVNKGTLKPEYLSCESNFDCEVIEFCGAWMAVNARNARHVKDGGVSCKQSIPSGSRPVVSCVNHVCTLIKNLENKI